jgi:hypothetical protein
MSLEQSLDRTNELLQAIITILQTGVSAPAELLGTTSASIGTIEAAIQAGGEQTDGQGLPPAAEASKRRGRPAKTEAAAAPAPAAAPAAQAPAAQAPHTTDDTGPGVPVVAETEYFIVEKHRTAYKVEPGDLNPQVAGSSRVSKEVYEAKKAEYAKNVSLPASSQPAAPSTTPAATPAPATPAASPATSQPSAQASADVPFPQIVERITALHKSPEPGHGREGVLAVLRKWLPNDPKPAVTKLQPLGKNAEILADIEALLNPVLEADGSAEDEFDPLA